MNKYEISLWEDYSDIVSTSAGDKVILKERKIAVIGSDTMEAQARALEPNLIEEINGTNTFTFKMYYTYTDNQTGEKCPNPFAKYLVNERKVKVFWQDKWYDLVIKKCQEDSSKKIVTYTCKDLFVNELSKQGYSLEFNTELENNIGTAAELGKKVLEGSTWQYDDDASTPIIQKTEGPVYETNVVIGFTAAKQSPNGDENEVIPAGKKILVFYDSLVELLNITDSTTSVIQFLYDENGYQTDINDMLVTNGNCYEASFTFTKSNNILTASLNDEINFTIDLSTGVSNHYTANRLVKSQKTEYDALLDRYVLVCRDSENNKIYEIATTEYTNPLVVVNLIANPNNFTNVSGWIGQVEKFSVYPKFSASTNIATYTAKSYLKIKSGWTYNSGIQSNISYFTPNDSEIRLGMIGGIQVGEKFIFRAKVKSIDGEGNPDLNPDTPLIDAHYITPNVYLYDKDYQHKEEEDALFIQIDTVKTSDNWIEYTLVAKESVSVQELEKYGFFLKLEDDLWFEDIQFFKYAEGIVSYDEDAPVQRMNPGEVNLQSIIKQVYKYYDPNAQVADVKDMVFLYVGETESPDYTPEYNNYEKIGTITESKSNRFNILQSIAETFKAWVRFRIEHEDDGSIKIIDGTPCKYIYFVEELEYDNGLSFEYGIDLKTISRTIDGDKLATKVIVNPNTNEFATNGFCSIARSNENYSKENFILNLDYFIQQNLLDGDELNKDLYSVDYIGYYYYLHQYNEEYDNLTDELVVRQLDLIKQTSQKKVYEQYLLAANQQRENLQSDLINLAGVSSWEEVEPYAQSHTNNEKVQSLLNAYAKTGTEIQQYNNSLNDISSSLEELSGRIDSIIERQNQLVELIKTKHKQFNDKYTNYIMEGTWQDDEYIDDNKYYLDGLKIAYTSSRPQLSYSINVLRLSNLEEFSSKVFNLGDICYIQDREFFGYLLDGITPYKEKILVSKISSFFDQPEKDTLTVQNYKTRFDDLFQRIAASSQNFEYAEGSYQRAADSITSNGTIDSALLQDTFDQNSDIVLNSSNQDVIWDDTGITVTDKFNTANKTKILAGGIFITDDGGLTWKNAIRGDGISTNLLTAGRINTNEIYIYDGNTPSFRWDSYGITAYSFDNTGVKFNKFVRHDKYGIYGYDGGEKNKSDFLPNNEEEIWATAKFGLTWNGFFLKSTDAETVFEISTNNDLIITKNNIKRVQIGRLDVDKYGYGSYGIALSDGFGSDVFIVDTNSDYVKIGGWNVSNNELYQQQIEEETGKLISKTSLETGGNIHGKYIIEDQYAIKTVIQTQTIETNNEGIALLGENTFDYYDIIAGGTIDVTVDGVTETVTCQVVNDRLVAITTTTNPIVTLYVGTRECGSTANTTFSIEAVASVQDYGEWSLGNHVQFDDKNAVISIADVLIDSNGIQTKKLYVRDEFTCKNIGLLTGMIINFGFDSQASEFQLDFCLNDEIYRLCWSTTYIAYNAYVGNEWQVIWIK